MLFPLGFKSYPCHRVKIDKQLLPSISSLPSFLANILPFHTSPLQFFFDLSLQSIKKNLGVNHPSAILSPFLFSTANLHILYKPTNMPFQQLHNRNLLRLRRYITTISKRTLPSSIIKHDSSILSQQRTVKTQITNTNGTFSSTNAFSNSHSFTTSQRAAHANKISCQASWSYYTIHPTLHTIRRALHHGPSFPSIKTAPFSRILKEYQAAERSKLKKLQWRSAIPARKKNP